MSSAICFNLDHSKILLSGNGVKYLRNTKVLKKLTFNLMQEDHKGKKQSYL